VLQLVKQTVALHSRSLCTNAAGEGGWRLKHTLYTQVELAILTSLLAAHQFEYFAQILTEKSLQTASHYWIELRGNMYSEYMVRVSNMSGDTLLE
jgi:hypothetical protein